MCDPGRGRPSFRGVVLNWRDYDAPFHVKLRLLLRNNWRKLSTFSHCCGNGGEPGC